MTTTDDFNLDDEDETPRRWGNTAPDWGHRYGITELWSEIKDGLFVGGTHDNDTVIDARVGKRSVWGDFYVHENAEIGPDEFDAVVTLYAWARPVDWLVEEYRWGIFDGGSKAPDVDNIRDVVVWAHKRWKAGKKVLFRCQAGLSRSPFFTALTLVRDGLEVEDAINLIREKRSPYCLTLNGSGSRGHFSTILRETPPEFWRD
jgi:hypothetical protein